MASSSVDYLKINRLLPLLAPVDHKLTTAEQNGKALDLGDETKYAYVCVNDESSGSANGTKEMIPHWIEVWSGHYTYKREQRVHFSLEPVESKPDHYKLIHRYGKFLGRGEKAEYFRMFENGGELKIVKIENKERFPGNLKGPLIIESSKLNRTYHYRADPIYGCAYPSC